MFNNLLKKYIYPIVVFSSGIVGVGFLSLPYITMNVGFWPMLIYFLIITGITIFINTIFCEISLKTPDYKRFPGFVGYYLGGKVKFISIISTIVGTIGVLLSYLIVGGQFLENIFSKYISINPLIYVLAYFLLASIVIFFDIKVLAKVELWIIVALLLSIFLIFFEGFRQMKIDNIFSIGNLSFRNFFLPYGPLLFSLWGVGMIPEIEEMMVDNKKHLKKNIIISLIGISIFYFLFSILILGITGDKTGQTALVELKMFLPSIFVSIALLVGVFTTFVAFVSQGIIFKKTLTFDLKVKHIPAFIMTCCPPMIFFLTLRSDFVSVLSFIGAIFLGINGIMILAMYKKIGGKIIIIYPLVLVFLLGIIYEIIYL